MPSVSILTTTYNRGHKIGGLYDSLVSQSCLDFEWIVVIDGSTDQTEELVREWSRQAPFPIRLVVKENGGKHTALNRAFDIMQGEFAVIVDDDDIMLTDAVKNIVSLGKKTLQVHKEARKSAQSPICGFATPVVHFDSNPITTDTPDDGTVTEYMTLRYRTKTLGDIAEVYRVKYLRQFRFPEFSGEKFCGENYLSASLALHFRLIWYDKPLFMREYPPDGLSSKFVRLMIASPHCAATLYSLLARHPLQTFKGRIISMTTYWTYIMFSKLPWRLRIQQVGIASLPCLIPAAALRLYYKLNPHAWPLT